MFEENCVFVSTCEGERGERERVRWTGRSRVGFGWDDLREERRFFGGEIGKG